MELEFIKDKVYYKIFDLNYKGSTGVYSKKNNVSAVKMAEIDKNIATIKSDYKINDILFLNQVHGADVAISNSSKSESRPEADASITHYHNQALAIMTADCVPVFFASDCGNLIGAAHCGWRSAKAGIIGKVAKNMQANGARQIKAIIGPAIAQYSYEVDSEYYNNFVKDDVNNSQFFIKSKKKDHYMFDLPTFVAKQLCIEEIEIFKHITDDTYSMPEKYPSYRRFTHNNQPYSHNILSTIVIK